jgi:hypothetical protein
MPALGQVRPWPTSRWHGRSTPSSRNTRAFRRLRFVREADFNSKPTTSAKQMTRNSRRGESRRTQIDNDLATALACSMNNLANGPQARFFSVRMAIA